MQTMLYKQIARELTFAILAGEFQTGCCLPTIREISSQYQVNPNTVQRAVSELEQRGLVTSTKGRGTEVTADAESLDSIRRTCGRELTAAFVGKMSCLGYSCQEIRAAVLENAQQHGEKERP